jgi:hypothetical protein
MAPKGSRKKWPSLRSSSSYSFLLGRNGFFWAISTLLREHQTRTTPTLIVGLLENSEEQETTST